MKSRNVAAVLTLIVALCQAPPAYADVIAFPTTTGAGLVPDVWAALIFVVLVSGISFFLLRRVARRRAAAAATFAGSAPMSVPVPPVEGPSANDEH